MFHFGLILLVAGCQAVSPILNQPGINDGANATPSDYVFECTGVGMFPDPYVCTIYHVCYEQDTIFQDDQHECEHGWIYDSLLKMCSTESAKCPKDPPVPTCTRKDQIGSLKRNPNIYYHCVFNADGTYLYPILYECPHGGYFDNGTFACIAESTTTTTATVRSTTTRRATTTTPRTTTTRATTTTPRTTTTRKTTTTPITTTTRKTTTTPRTTTTRATTTTPRTTTTRATTTTPTTTTTRATTTTARTTTTPTTTTTRATTTTPSTTTTPTTTTTRATTTTPRTTSTSTTTTRATTTTPRTTTTTTTTRATTTTLRTTTTPTTTTTRATTTTPTTTAAPVFHCTFPGFYVDSNDCYSYYECSLFLQASHHTCPTGSHFSSVFRVCTLGTCSNFV